MLRSPKDDTRYARLAAEALAAEEPSAAPIGLGDRVADLAAIERALRSRARDRRRPRLIVACGAAAAAVILIVAMRTSPPAPVGRSEGAAVQPPRRPSLLSIAMLEGTGASFALRDGDGDGNGDSDGPVTVGQELAPGTRLRVPPGGGVTLALVTGTRLDLGGGAAARVVELGSIQRFALAAGSLVARVAKLGPEGRFIITTPDAEVEVKGTRFEVTVNPEPSSCEPRVRTRVIVQEGVVVVRSNATEVRLEAGRRWPDCQAPRTVVVRPSQQQPAKSPRAAPAPEASRQLMPAREAAPASTLADQNDLFAAALAAGRRGDVAEAVHWLDQIIARYPTGQLTDSARAERRRLTESPGRRAPGE